jgi:hypothetical protein
MHIHANNNLALASLGAGRDEIREIQARRAAEVRRKLSSASRGIESGAEDSDAERVEARSYSDGSSRAHDENFRRLFSAKA